MNNKAEFMKEQIKKWQQKEWEKKLKEIVEKEDLQRWAKGQVGFQGYFYKVKENKK